MTGAPLKSTSQDFPKPTASSAFDPKSAIGHLEAVCKLGARITGTDAMHRQQKMLTAYFEALGAAVELQSFVFSPGSQPNRKIQGDNLIVCWNKTATRRVLLSCHYDTRPHADEEPVERNRLGNFIGANDGASGVALFMELGRVMPGLKLPFGVDFVFFDAEEYILERQADSYFVGSEFFARMYATGSPGFKYEAVVNFDMVADKELEIFVDQASAAKAGALAKEFWDAAKIIGVKEFVWKIRHDIQDDHISFHKYDIPAIDIIDFDYPHWHRLADTPDKCSGESLEKVAKVTLEWLKRRS